MTTEEQIRHLTRKADEHDRRASRHRQEALETGSDQVEAAADAHEAARDANDQAAEALKAHLRGGCYETVVRAARAAGRAADDAEAARDAVREEDRWNTPDEERETEALRTSADEALDSAISAMAIIHGLFPPRT